MEGQRMAIGQEAPPAADDKNECKATCHPPPPSPMGDRHRFCRSPLYVCPAGAAEGYRPHTERCAPAPRPRVDLLLKVG